MGTAFDRFCRPFCESKNLANLVKNISDLIKKKFLILDMKESCSKVFPIKASTFSGETTNGEIIIVEYSRAQIISKTLRNTILALLITALLLFIPLLHFLLVPIGIITTIGIFIRTSGTRSIITSGHAPCPACGETIMLAKRNYRMPLKDICENCHREVVIKSNRET